MKKLVYILFIVSLQFVAFGGNADKERSNNRTVTGKVTDLSGEALAGTKITIKETGETFFADLEGNFKFSLETNQVYSLQVETIGYQPKVLKSTQLSVFNELSLTEL